MTAATISTRIPTFSTKNEMVVLEATDGETFESEKFGTVDWARATLMEDGGTSLSIPCSVAISGAEVTVHCNGMSDKDVLLELGSIGK